MIYIAARDLTLFTNLKSRLFKKLDSLIRIYFTVTCKSLVPAVFCHRKKHLFAESDYIVRIFNTVKEKKPVLTCGLPAMDTGYIKIISEQFIKQRQSAYLIKLPAAVFHKLARI